MIKILTAGEFKDGRKKGQSETVSKDIVRTVSDIISDVASRGDEAVREYTKKFDKCILDTFEISPSAFDSAIAEVGQDFIGIMVRAARNIEEFHSHQIRDDYILTPGDGVILGQRITPIEKVGIHVPGFSVPHPSTVLMNCIPAKLAGVKEIIIVTPPKKDGSVSPEILAAARIGGANRVLSIAGAQAVAALAYGTESVPKVDKIVGPGNAYVAEAKRQVFGIVGIDMMAGPSDILVIADEAANPVYIAADMLSQTEHSTDSIAVLVTECRDLARAVSEEIELQLVDLPRRECAGVAIDNNSMIIISDSIDHSFELSNEIAPEHLEVHLDDPMKYLDRITNAGSIFLGKNTPEALGDYFAGPNHTLPTLGTARFSSALSVDDFCKKSSFTYYSGKALREAAPHVVAFAERECLQAHALSVSCRVL